MHWIPLTLGALGALLLVLAPGAELGLKARPLPQEPLACLGETRSLIVSSGMPYTPVRVQGHTGFFVVDLGADGSAISPGTFLGGAAGKAAVGAGSSGGNSAAGAGGAAGGAGGAATPVPLPGSSDRFAGVDFFGPWAPLRLSVQDHSGIRGPLPQAGLIGTDLLNAHVITLDYANGLLRRAPAAGFCSDGELRRAGFLPLSSRDYYGTSGSALRCPASPRRGGCPNIPTIPLRIGSVGAVAQVDTGYADGLRPPSMNINRALLQRLERAGMPLIREPGADLTLSSCVRGAVERVLAYRLAAGRAVELVGSDGGAVRRLPGVTLFLKDSPAAIQACGGIGTWSEPAAQLGASFVNDGTLVVDPFSQRLWFRGGLKPLGAQGFRGSLDRGQT
ncbi:MAG: hypothetical protein NTW51_15100 [Cyanobacteria bacterium]|nr:hypothetical protein [Cyanobacteriota bacterium]